MGAKFDAATFKNQLIDNFEKLPRSDVKEILDFAEFVIAKRFKRKRLLIEPKLNPKEDPILKLIGIADTTPFAGNIDQELYG